MGKQKRTPKDIGGKRVIYGAGGGIDTALLDIAFESFNKFLTFIFETTQTISDVHYLPASRSGLYQALSAFGQIIAELSKRRSFLSQRIELPAISEPLVDYFIKLTESKPPKRADENKFSAIAEELERLILKGAVEFDQKSKRLFYKPFDLG